jgi:hypothetical protein
MNNRPIPESNPFLCVAGWLVKGMYLFSLSFVLLHLFLLPFGIKLPSDWFIAMLLRTGVATGALFFIGACWSALFGR